MKKLLVREIMAPLVRRIGTGLAAFLAGTLAADPALVDQFVVAATALVFVSTDLVLSHFDRKQQEVD